jgi:hypothetical protein
VGIPQLRQPDARPEQGCAAEDGRLTVKATALIMLALAAIGAYVIIKRTGVAG